MARLNYALTNVLEEKNQMHIIMFVKSSIYILVKVNSTVNGYILTILTFLDTPRATITMESRCFSMEPASNLLTDKYSKPARSLRYPRVRSWCACAYQFAAITRDIMAIRQSAQLHACCDEDDDFCLFLE